MTILRTVILLILLVLLSRSGQAQTPAYPGAIAGDCQTTVAKDSATSLVTALAAASGTLIRVSNTGAFVLCQIVSVGREQMLITAISSSGLTVTRAFAGTQAATIYPGSVITGNINAWSFNALRVEIQAIETTLGPNLSNIGAASIPHTTNVLSGNGSGGVLDSGVAPGNIAGISTTNSFTGYQNILSGRLSLPEATFASLPASPLFHQVFLFTDALSLGTCTGGGTAFAQCRWNGSAYTSISGGGGSGGGFDAITSGTNTTATMTVGTGASLVRTGSGIIDANKILGTTLTSITGLGKFTSGVPSAAVVADVTGLFSGCSGVLYLGADGACHSPGGTITTVSVKNTVACVPASASGLAYTCAPTTPAAALSDLQGLPIDFVPDVANTSATPTLAISGLTAKTIVSANGQSLSLGELIPNVHYHLTYNGTALQRVAEQLVAGGSGGIAIDRTTNPPTVDITGVVMTKGGTNNVTGTINASGGSKTAPFRIGASDPATCDNTVREFFFNSTSNLLKSCNALNTWTAISGSSGPTLTTGYGWHAPFGIGQVFGGANSPLAAVLNGDVTANGTVYYQFVLPFSMTITSLQVGISAQAGSGKYVVVGLCDRDGALLSSGHANNPAGPTRFTLASPQTLAAGVYTIAVVDEAIGTTTYYITSAGNQSNISQSADGFTTTGEPRVFTCSNAVTGTGASYALPATCGSKSSRYYYPTPLVILYP